MPYSNLTSVLDTAALTAINTQLSTLQTALSTHSINLTPQEVQGLYKMDEQRQSLGTRCLQIAEGNSGLVPSFLNVSEAKKDMERYMNLFAIQSKLEGLLAGITDARTASGSEVLLFVRGFYKSLEAAAEQNVPGAKAYYTELKTYFDLPSQPNTPAVNEVV